MTYLMELASCYTGDATRYINTGFVLALLFPVGLSLAVGFHQEKTTRTMELIFTLVPMLICLLSFVFFFVVVLTGGFDSAFDSMERKQQRTAGSSEDAETSPLLEAGRGAVD